MAANTCTEGDEPRTEASLPVDSGDEQAANTSSGRTSEWENSDPERGSSEDRGSASCISSEAGRSEGMVSVTMKFLGKLPLTDGALLVVFIGFLYMFVCSLGLMGSAFQLLGGKEAGQSLSNNEIAGNPVAGLVIGILATVLVQSSSTSTSVIITMTASELLTIKQAIYMVMGANIGTSVTNTIVALGQLKDRNEFQQAFAGATVHDMFNFLTVLILLPLEAASGYLFRLTEAIIDSWNLTTDKDSKKDFLKKLTKPLTDRIVQIDKKQIEKIAKKEITTSEAKLLKETCSSYTVNIPNCGVNATTAAVVTTNLTATAGPTIVTTTLKVADNNFTNTTSPSAVPSCIAQVDVPCDYLFYHTGLSDAAVGAILLIISLIVLCISLFVMVKILTHILKGHIAATAKKVVNADFPGRARHLTGYVAMLIGAAITILVQSSSVFTSSITPLVGLGIISLERMYPLTLGSNIGTTVTGILAALASSNVTQAMQVAMAHLFFNISGILIWYPIPVMRRFPIACARYLGKVTFKYRWFAFVYIILAFFLVPLFVFGLSLAGWQVLTGVGVPVLVLILLIIFVNVLQRKSPKTLPKPLRTWDFLPVWLRSLEPADAALTALGKACCRRRRLGDEESADKVPVPNPVHAQEMNPVSTGCEDFMY